MTIHVVQPGETIDVIAQGYGVSPSSIIKNNELKDPNLLAVGQTLVILYPSLVHIVNPGETLRGVAQQYNTSVVSLLRNNPEIADANQIYPGQEIVIAYEGEKLGTIAVNGYAYPYIDREILRKTLPYLTYITLFTYGITPEGELIEIEDEEVIRIAKDFGVAPLMLISTLGEDGRFSNELASAVVNDFALQNRLIENILENLERKGYYGLDIDFEYVFPEDRDAYVTFIQNVTQRLNAEGYPVITALAPKVSADQPGLLYEGHDYAGIGAASNYVLLMTYEWGFTYGPPMAVAPINKVREVLDYAVTEISPDKILMGIPNYGYDWTLPYERGVTKAPSIGNQQAAELAAAVGAVIEFDPVSQAPFFYYIAQDGREHVVWFEDARSIDAKLRLVPEYGFYGVSYWNLMRYFPQNWLVVNSLFEIVKVL